ncbi:protein Diedel-like isoform X3 [Leptopilina heterotoma]|uniref:protein Diedel-like isoform X3 n=1 Tax=Leptopilina heterotoma TaxID=63436 RepID=UPI001CA9D173|nr:protein Diedel-like isoform X3 [Leptopilina heterotoma]
MEKNPKENNPTVAMVHAIYSAAIVTVVAFPEMLPKALKHYMEIKCAILRYKFYEQRGDCLTFACGDGKSLKGKDSYCGIGSCNIFGCNCDGGCIPGNATESFKALHGNKVRNVRL